MFLLDNRRESIAHRDLLRCHARHLRNLFLESAHAGFMSVFVNDFGQCCLVYLELFLVYAMLLQLLGNEEFLGDFHLLLSQVASDIDKLHSVQQSRLDGRNIIGSSYEQNMGQVIVEIQIVVMERSVLLRVQNLKQS